ESFENEGSLSEDIELLKSSFLLEKALRNLNLNISYYSEGDILTEEKYLLSSYHITVFELHDSTLIGTPIHIEKIENGIQLSFINAGQLNVVPLLEGEIVDNSFFKFVFKITDAERFEQSITENSLYFVF